MSITITMTGPLFDGRAARALRLVADEARDDIAEYGEEIALREMGMNFQHPTGYYESNVKTTLVSADTARVDDSGVVYGAWLEGVGSRNYPATRFKGYHHWRTAKQAVATHGPALAQRALVRHLGEMN